MQKEIRVEFDPSLQLLLLFGDATAMQRHPLFGSFLRSNGAIQTQRGIALPTEHESLHSKYRDLAKVVTRAGFLLLEDATGGALAKVQRDEGDFAAFASTAASIWQGDVNPSQLSVFVEQLLAACPGRRFYEKQLLSAFHLAFARNACNFSVPGAGKTSIVYAAYASLNHLPESNPHHVNHLLIVGPLSSFKAWQDEFREIFLRDARAKRIAGFTPPGERGAYLRGVSYGDRDVELTLTSYASLASNLEDFRTFLASPTRSTMLVLDEAHNIKRPDGYWASAAIEIAPLAKARVVLTGTPAPNGYEDLSNLFRFIYPKRNLIGFSNAALKAMSAGANPAGVDRLKEHIRPFYTRIRKQDLALPRTAEERIPITLSPEHRRIYDRVERTIIPQLRTAAQTGRSTLVRARLMRLRQAAVNPALLLRPLEEEGLLEVDRESVFSIPEIEIADLVSGFDPRRQLLRLLDAVQLARRVVADQGKVLIWSYFIGNLALLREALAGSADFVEVITGATPISEEGAEEEDASSLPTREALINRFHAKGETSILIANPQAVGESISLHKVCRTAIYFDRDFNAGKFIQSKDRIHRYNPDPIGDVTYHLLIGERTLETSIDRRLVVKEQRLADLIDTDEIPLFSLGSEDSEQGADIRAILEDYERRKTL